jgi:PAS domain S-box-containing protein
MASERRGTADSERSGKRDRPRLGSPLDTAAQYEDLYQNAPIAYLTLDKWGLVLDANDMSVKLLGWERERLIGKPLVRDVAESDRSVFLEHMYRCRCFGSARNELRLLARDGEVVAELHSRRVMAGGPGAPRYQTVVIDRRDRRRADEAKAEANRERRRADDRERAAHASSEAKDRFLAELSHELRTPLTPILSAVTMLAASRDVPERLRQTIDMIRRNVEIEARLIDDLLDVSRIARKRIRLLRQGLEAHELLRAVASELASEAETRGIRFLLRLNAREAWLRADPVRMRQIVLNLVSNALHSTPKGGWVEVSSWNVAHNLRIAVRDNGAGIEPDKLASIFTAFSLEDSSPRGRAGLGLGLAITKGLVEAHGGWIAAFSDGKGQGALFVVELPIAEPITPTRATPAPEPGETPAPSGAASAPPGGHKRVLLVEDHADTRAALKVLLELKGYEVSLAEDAASALRAAAAPLDVIVCDIGLPDGSGLDVVRKIAAEKPIKAIALSGYGTPRDVELSSQAGFAAHLVKPVGAEELVETIEAVCGGECAG